MMFRGHYGFLSNMYICQIEYNGLRFSSVEAAFQAAKCLDPKDMVQFTGLDPRHAKRAGRMVPMRKDWDEIKVTVMTELVEQKFKDPVLIARLQQIEGDIVEDNTWGDTFWGRCNGEGENHLGVILTRIRDSARKHKEVPVRFYLLIAGSRSFNDYRTLAHVADAVLRKRLRDGEDITIIHGAARGADALADRYARERGFHVVPFPAEWKKYGNAAGYIRNRVMHEYLSKQDPSGKYRGCLCFWDELSRGTKHNFDLCKEFGTPLRVYRFSKPS